MSIFQQTTTYLADIELFSRWVLQCPLRDYQLAPIRSVVESVLFRRGREYLVIFPRQSGKNEAVAQLCAYLLNLLQRRGGNIIHGATGDALGMAIDRLQLRLDNKWNTGRWCKRTRPERIQLGQAAVLFLSTHPSASVRGQTAHWLLIVDELQDQSEPHIEAVYTPMRAANNATALYLGTVRTRQDLLWRKRLELERIQVGDGLQRVFLTGPERVCLEVPAYKTFLEAQVDRLGRDHPIIASEYYLEPIGGGGLLFDRRRRTLMRGQHLRPAGPSRGGAIVATLDLAGQDEAATDPLAQLDNPGRDYTVATVFQVHLPAPGRSDPSAGPPLPVYRALDVLVDHGTRHFESFPGLPSLAEQLARWLETWGVLHLVADESGVGQGLVSWLKTRLGDHRVTGYNFSRPGAKAALGSAFVALIETGRFRYWIGDEDQPLSDGWWFWQQVAACAYDLPPDGRFERHLRWGVPISATVNTPLGRQPLHDDRLISAALIAEVDRLYAGGLLRLGEARSIVVPPQDPLEGETF